MARTATQQKSGRNGNIAKKHNSGVKIPDELKKLRGTFSKKNADLAARKVGADSAKDLMLPVDVPEFMMECPETLVHPIARAEWNMFIKPLITANVIKLTDIRTAEVYCDLWAAYQEVKAKTGFPPVKIAEPMIRLMMQMGLTPVSRHKVVRIMKDNGKVHRDDWSQILNHEDDEDA